MNTIKILYIYIIYLNKNYNLLITIRDIFLIENLNQSKLILIISLIKEKNKNKSHLFKKVILFLYMIEKL